MGRERQKKNMDDGFAHSGAARYNATEWYVCEEELEPRVGYIVGISLSSRYPIHSSTSTGNRLDRETYILRYRRTPEI